MNTDWQQIVVVVAVAAAAMYLGRRAWVMIARKRGAGCGSCSNCPTETTPEGNQMVGIESLKATGRKGQG